MRKAAYAPPMVLWSWTLPTVVASDATSSATVYKWHTKQLKYLGKILVRDLEGCYGPLTGIDRLQEFPQ
jgi:hypothetical protein